MWTELSKLLLGAKPYPMITYFRYIIFEIGLEGFIQTRTVDELLWGYQDEFLENLKNTDPLDAGNPSINSWVSIGGVNSSYEEAKDFPMSMYTGTNQSKITRNIRQFYQSNEIKIPFQYFNGNETVSTYNNPWPENIELRGSDGSVNIPGLTKNDKVPLAMTDFSFQTELTFSGKTIDYHGVPAYRFVLPKQALQNKTNNPENKRWYADRWNGFINLSSVNGAPFFVSKGHYLDTDLEISQGIEIYKDNSMKEKIEASSADEFYMDIEPYSGVALGTSASFQINYHFKNDELFCNLNEGMLPVLLAGKEFKLSESQVN